MKRLVIACATLALASSCFAQTATLNGVVTDPSDAVITGARVQVTNLETGLHREVQTSDVGAYTFNLLPVGTYKVEASRTGFGTSQTPDLKLEVGQVARLDFRLKPGAIVESVEVSSAAALLDTDTASVGQVVSNKLIVEMPLNGRNYLSLANAASGTAPSVGGRTAQEGGFVAAGQHGYQVNILVDGLDNASTASGGPLGFEAQAVKPSIDAIGEFKVLTSNMSAEYGGKMGGTVVVTLKSGTNHLHGSAFEFLRNDKLDASNFFANRSGAPKPEYRQNQFGGTLGGPIRKNRTFIFGSFEGTRIRTGTSSISTVPTAAELNNGDFSKIRHIFDPATTQG